MRIAMVSTIYKATPPAGYGGIERVVHHLTEELVRQGHDVVLFGARGSSCSGRTVAIDAYDPTRAPSGVQRRADVLSEEPLYEAMSAYFRDHPVDVIHDWSFQNLFAERHPERVPVLISTSIPLPPGFRRRNLVACSRAHAAQVGGDTRFVHYGLRLEEWPATLPKNDHVVHIAKIARYKGQHLAVLAARRARRRLVLAGNIEDRLYYNAVIRPMLWASPNVRHLGEVKGTLDCLADAGALVQTPRWFEAFPLVVLEALACGTPVVALAEGGIPEQVVHGVTGYLCRSLAELADALEEVRGIRPADCRAYAEEHFSVARMAQAYVALYERVREGEHW